MTLKALNTTKAKFANTVDHKLIMSHLIWFYNVCLLVFRVELKVCVCVCVFLLVEIILLSAFLIYLGLNLQY